MDKGNKGREVWGKGRRGEGKGKANTAEGYFKPFAFDKKRDLKKKKKETKEKLFTELFPK